MNDLISPEELREQRRAGAAPTVIDVRGHEEYAAGHIPGALHIPTDQLTERLSEISRDRPIVTY